MFLPHRDESDHPDQVNISEKLKQQAVPQTNHFNSYVIPEPEVIQSEGLLEEKREGFVGEVEIQVAPREMAPARGKSPASRIVEVEVLAPGSTPVSQLPSRAPSRAVSSPPVLRNGTPIKQNGMPGYQRGPTPSSQTPVRVQRRSALEKVENWVKVQKEERHGWVVTSVSYFYTGEIQIIIFFLLFVPCNDIAEVVRVVWCMLLWIQSQTHCS